MRVVLESAAEAFVGSLEPEGAVFGAGGTQSRADAGGRGGLRAISLAW